MNKEWKGNSKSVHALLGVNKRCDKNGREADDFYATDPVALELLLEAGNKDYEYAYDGKYVAPIRLRNEKFYIWEPAAGVGNLSNFLLERGYQVFATDIKDRGANGVIGGIDFLKADPNGLTQIYPVFTPRIIITNPPYSLATEFILHALEVLRDGGLYIALMNISYLAGIDRYKRVYSKGCLREVYIFSKRIECWRNNNPNLQSGHMANYAWYIFQKGYFGQPTLYWL